MKALVFLKKEMLDALRSGKLLILGILFVAFGIMNPAIAKLTPLLMDMFAEDLAGTGLIIEDIAVDASTSWVQFFKNIPMALIVYIIVCGNIFTKEYRSGTLILMLTKGLGRCHALIAKAAVLLLGWSAGYFICFAITYGVNALLWDNSIMSHLAAAVLAWWLFGIFTVSLAVFFSVISNGFSGVMLGTVAAVAVSYILNLIPKLAPYTPTSLMSVTDGKITKAVIVTVVLSAALLISSVPIMNKKSL